MDKETLAPKIIFYISLKITTHRCRKFSKDKTDKLKAKAICRYILVGYRKQMIKKKIY